MDISINNKAATANRCVSYLYWSLFAVYENKQGVTSLFILIVFFSPTAVFAVITQDPMQNYLKDSPPYKEDKLLTYTVDLNEDGRDEVFLSTDSKYLDNAKAGRSWTLYVSIPGGYIYSQKKSDFALSFDPPQTLVRLNNGRLGIVHYHASSARTGGLVAYYLDTNNVLHFQKLDDIQAEPGEFGEKYTQAITARASAAPEAKTSYKVHKLDEVYTPAQIAGLKSYADDFYSNHYIRIDPDDPRASLVYRNSDNVLVGREKFGVFTPLEQTGMTPDQVQRAKDIVKPGPGTPGYVPPTNQAVSTQPAQDQINTEQVNRLPLIALILGLTLVLGVGIAMMLKRKKTK